MTVTLPPGYKPKPQEEFMNSYQLEYFRQKLQRWRSELLREGEETLSNLKDSDFQESDLADRASTEMERSLELRTGDRARKLINKIDAALRRIGEPEEIGGAAVFLASKAGSFMTGQTVVLDGGR